MPEGSVQVMLRRFAGVSSVDPVDVPVRIEGEDETGLKCSAGGDRRGGRDQFRGQMLGLYRAGATVANYRKLRMSGQEREEKTDRDEQGVANFHLM